MAAITKFSDEKLRINQLKHSIAASEIFATESKIEHTNTMNTLVADSFAVLHNIYRLCELCDYANYANPKTEPKTGF